MNYPIKFFALLMTLISFINTQAQNFDGRLVLGEKIAKEEIKKTLNGTQKSFYDTLITDKETAIAVAEPILFKYYGKDQILSERPYEIYLIDEYWFITGTIPEGSKGGAFIIIINSMNGQIIKLIHGK